MNIFRVGKKVSTSDESFSRSGILEILSTAQH